jgi:hypothetical protein
LDTYPEGMPYLERQSDLLLGKLAGLDNTPAFADHRAQHLDPAFKEAREWVITAHPDTPAARLVREWHAIVEASDREMDDKARAYLADYWGD